MVGSHADRRSQGARLAVQLGEISGLADGEASASRSMRLTKPASTEPEPSSTKWVMPWRAHPLDGLSPAYAVGELGLQIGADFGGGGQRAGRDVADNGHLRVLNGSSIDSLVELGLGGPHKGEWAAMLTARGMARRAPACLGQGQGQREGGFRARNDHLTGAVVVGHLHHLVVGSPVCWVWRACWVASAQIGRGWGYRAP